MSLRNILLRPGRTCFLGVSRQTCNALLFSPFRRHLIRSSVSSHLSIHPAARYATAARRLPERLLIFHAGTPRTTFLACLKVTTLFGLAFFTFLVAPAYVVGGRPWYEAVGVAACGVVPFALVTYTTAPFVAFVHLRLPHFARGVSAGVGAGVGAGAADRPVLRRFVHSLPPATLLDFTTMSLVGRARVTTVAAGDLAPTRERLRIVNLVNSQPKLPAGPLLSARFPWVRLPPPTRFGAPRGSNSRGTREAWAWDEVLDGVERRTGGKTSPKA